MTGTGAGRGMGLLMAESNRDAVRGAAAERKETAHAIRT
jgi:hypothetical protein